MQRQRKQDKDRTLTSFFGSINTSNIGDGIIRFNSGTEIFFFQWNCHLLSKHYIKRNQNFLFQIVIDRFEFFELQNFNVAYLYSDFERGAPIKGYESLSHNGTTIIATIYRHWQDMKYDKKFSFWSPDCLGRGLPLNLKVSDKFHSIVRRIIGIFLTRL